MVDIILLTVEEGMIVDRHFRAKETAKRSKDSKEHMNSKKERLQWKGQKGSFTI
jgi:hypothetical protein